MSTLLMGQLLWGSFLLIVPGLSFLLIINAHQRLGRLSTLILSPGLSIALIPLSLYLTTLLHIPQGELFVQVTAFSTLIVALILFWLQREYWLRPIDRESLFIAAALLSTFFVTLTARIWSTRDLAFPLWTDSYHHTMIAQLIVESGRIPDGYRPYAPIDAFTYHFGFHSLTAWYHWMTDVPVPRATVTMGQILNALAVPMLYCLGSYFFNNRWIGLGAALLVGMFSHMPAQYVNWGRYTQLGGLTLLPVAMILSMLSITSKRNLLLLVTASTVALALFFTHYRIFLFYVIWMGIYWIYQIWHAQHQRPLLMRAGVLGGTFLVTGLPWFSHLSTGFGGNMAREVISGYTPDRHGTYFSSEISLLLEFGLNGWLVSLVGAAVILGVIRRNTEVMLVIGWIGALFATANLHYVGITPLYPTNVVLISLYLPGILLASYASVQIGKWVHQRFLMKHEQIQTHVAVVCLLSLLALSVQGIHATNQIVSPQNGFVTQADIIAMEWLKESVEEDALFYVDTLFWTPLVAHGIDAGYWLPLLTGYQTIMPPQIYASDGEENYIHFINQRLVDLQMAQTPQKFWETLLTHQITHIYQGSQNHNDAGRFSNHPEYFSVLYHHEGVWIFEVNAEISPPASSHNQIAGVDS